LAKCFDHTISLGSSFVALLLAVIFLAAMGAPGLSQENHANEPLSETHPPIHIQADRLVTDTRQNTAEFIGHVTAKQENTVITSNRLTVFYRNSTTAEPGAGMDAIVRIVAQGSVKIEFDDQTAYTDQAEYVADQRTIVLTGPKSRIVSGDNSISGHTITLYRDDGRVHVEGSADMPVEAYFYTDENGLSSSVDKK